MKDLKLNRRIKEIKLGIYLNRTSKIRNKEQYDTVMGVLVSFAQTFGKSSVLSLDRALTNSIGDGFIEASRKELVACLRTYFGVRESIKNLDIYYSAFMSKYGDLMSRDFIDDDFVNSLEPRMILEGDFETVDNMLSIIDNFRLPKEYNIVDELDEKRTLELDFYLIYSRLMSLFRNDVFISKLFYNLSVNFNLDYPSIMSLKNSAHIISREFPKLKYNNVYFKQELFTLFTKRGYTKGKIGREILGRNSNYCHLKSSRISFAKIIPDSDLDWQFTPTVYWENIDTESIKVLIKILHVFTDFFNER